MLVLFEMMGFGTIKIFLAGIPESLGLLAFGIGLVGMAVLIRRIMGRGQTEQEMNGSQKGVNNRR